MHLVAATAAAAAAAPAGSGQRWQRWHGQCGSGGCRGPGGAPGGQANAWAYGGVERQAAPPRAGSIRLAAPTPHPKLQTVFTSAPWSSQGALTQGGGVAIAYSTEVHIPQGTGHPQIPKVRYKPWPHTLGKVEVYTLGTNDCQRSKQGPKRVSKRTPESINGTNAVLTTCNA